MAKKRIMGAGLRLVSYPSRLSYLHVSKGPGGEQRHYRIDSVDDLGRPPMGRLMARIAEDEKLTEIAPDQLSATTGVSLDSPAGMLSANLYRHFPVLMINNNGSLSRCNLEEYVYRAGTYWLWHNLSDVALYRRFFAEAFHDRALYQRWFFEPPTPTRAIAKKNRQRPVLAYCGRLENEKRVDLLIHLLARVRRSVDATLVLSGEFPNTLDGLRYRQFVQRLVEELDLINHVRWLGHVDRATLSELMAEADLLLNLTVNHDETFGMAQAEALSLGTPVLAAAWGGLKEVVTEDCGFLVDCLVTDYGTYVDLDAAVEFIVDFLGDPQRQRAMSEAARSRSKEFSWQQFLSGLKMHLAGLHRRPLPSVSPEMPVVELCREVLSSQLFERLEPYLNPRAAALSLGEIHRLRNGSLFSKDEWFQYAIVDPDRHQQFVDENYLFLYEHYGSLTPDEALARLNPDCRLHLLRPRWRCLAGHGVSVDDPVFGSRIFQLSDDALRILEQCGQNRKASVATIVRNFALPASRVIDAARELISYGLVLPA